MACYRLTFKNTRVFEVIIESAVMAEIGLRQSGCVAVIYRVIHDARDHAPLLRSNSAPITIVAANEQAALEIAKSVLADACGSTLDGLSECGSGG